MGFWNSAVTIKNVAATSLGKLYNGIQTQKIFLKVSYQYIIQGLNPRECKTMILLLLPVFSISWVTYGIACFILHAMIWNVSYKFRLLRGWSQVCQLLWCTAAKVIQPAQVLKWYVLLVATEKQKIISILPFIPACSPGDMLIMHKKKRKKESYADCFWELLA